MKVDYQKPPVHTTYQFHPVHLQWLGFHVALSAILFYMTACRLPDGKAHLNPLILGVVGLLVIVVHTASYFLDNKKAGQIGSAKYTFMKVYQQVITKGLAACVLGATVLASFLPAPLWKFGLEISVITALCLWGSTKIKPQSTLHALKEPVKAILYTAGIWGCTWLTGESVNWESKALAGIFLFLTFQLLLLLSHFEALDRGATTGLARWLGKPRTRMVLYTLTVLICMACIALCFRTEFRYTQRVAVIFLATSLFQTYIFTKSAHTSSLKNWWLTAELSGILPLLLV